MSELKGENGDDPRLPADKPAPTPDRHLTDHPVESLSWQDIELDDDPPPSPADRDFKDLGSRPPPDSWSPELGAPVEPPEEQDLKERPEQTSRFERMRVSAYENAEAVRDATREAARTIDSLSDRPPVGQPETRSARPVFEPAPHYGVDAGDAASSLFLVGVLAGEGVRWSMDKLRRRFQEGRNDGSDR